MGRKSKSKPEKVKRKSENEESMSELTQDTRRKIGGRSPRSSRQPIAMATEIQGETQEKIPPPRRVNTRSSKTAINSEPTEVGLNNNAQIVQPGPSNIPNVGEILPGNKSKQRGSRSKNCDQLISENALDRTQGDCNYEEGELSDHDRAGVDVGVNSSDDDFEGESESSESSFSESGGSESSDSASSGDRERDSHRSQRRSYSPRSISRERCDWESELEDNPAVQRYIDRIVDKKVNDRIEANKGRDPKTDKLAPSRSVKRPQLSKPTPAKRRKLSTVKSPSDTTLYRPVLR